MAQPDATVNGVATRGPTARSPEIVSLLQAEKHKVLAHSGKESWNGLNIRPATYYFRCLRELVPPLLAKWELILGVHAANLGIRRMKTMWGACGVDTRRIWLNLELAKKPMQCLEYLVVHELVHLVERHHNDRFVSLMDGHLPQWRLHRQTLNAAPLGHATWTY